MDVGGRTMDVHGDLDMTGIFPYMTVLHGQIYLDHIVNLNVYTKHNMYIVLCFASTHTLLWQLAIS